MRFTPSLTRGVMLVLVSAGLLALVAPRPAAAATAQNGFGFNGSVRGFPTGSVRLTGGGAYNSTTGSVHAGGGFSCTADVGQGPLAGCHAGQGVRWDTSTLLRSTTFKCTGSSSEPLKFAATGDTTVVLLADFYRAGDGNDESFTAQMIVADTDIAPDIPGVQNMWVQGVGCGFAIANFN